MTARSAVAVLVLLVTVVFAPTVGGDFVWDDEVLISANARLRGEGAWQRALTDDFWHTSVPTDARHGYWRPVVKFSHVALLQRGVVAWPFHLLNGALHLACVLLAFRWLGARLRDEGVAPAEAVRPALLAAALFAVHPSRYEAVGWISCSTDLFMALFTLLALWALERRRFVTAAALVALALLSKESVVVLPLVILVDGWLRRRLEWRWLVAIGVGLIGPLVARAALGLHAPGVSFSDPWLAVPRSLAAFGVYHVRTAWPLPLTVLPHEVGGGESAARYGIPMILAGAGAAALWLGWGWLARSRPLARHSLADGGWWLVALLPFLQLVPTTSSTFASDRFLYLPLLGVSALLARWLAIAPWGAGVAAAPIVAGAVALSLGLPVYNSALEFFGREFRLHPDSPVIATAYAPQLQRSGHEEARRALLVRLSKQRTDLRTASWAVAHLAHATLALTADGDPRTLEALARFYDALLNGGAAPLELGDEVFPFPNPADAVHLAKKGMLDDLELFRATVALEQNRLDEALRRAERMAQVPTTRRLSLLARIHAARGELTRALGVVEGNSRELRSSALAETLRAAAQLPAEPHEPCGPSPRCGAETNALRRQWVEAWHQLQLRVREDAAIDALGPGPEKLGLQLQALISRRQDHEARELLDRERPGEPMEAQVRAALAAQQADREAELALVPAAGRP